jgi:hypothetical protein
VNATYTNEQPRYATVPAPRPRPRADDLTLTALHTGYSDLSELHIIGIRVSMKASGLLVEVWDSDPTPPQGSYLDSHLSSVAEISHRWNCYQPRSGGKVIWAELTH